MRRDPEAPGRAGGETTLIRPAAAAARGATSQGTWFEAPTPHGPLALCLHEAGGPAAHAAAAALALQRAAALLQPIDDWLGDGAPDWRWAPAPPAGPDAAALRLPWREGGHQLIAPWRWLRALPPPPPALAAELQWPAIEARLGITRLRLAGEQLQQLEPGGALLLPASMRPGWTGWLHGSTEPAEAGSALLLDDPARPRMRGHTPAPTQAGEITLDMDGMVGGRPCEVRLHLTRALPAGCLAGWCDEPLRDAIAPDLAASLWQCATVREPERCLAQGRLLPWGDGWALLIDGLGEETRQAAAQAHVLPG